MSPIGWMFMGLFWIVLLGLVAWAAMTLLPRGRSDQPARWGPTRETPMEILDRRFASGELTIEQYRQVRDELSAHRAG